MELFNFFKKSNKINRATLLIKISDYTLFNETFQGKFQPHWEYHNGIIKIDLGNDIVKFLNKRPFKFNTEFLLNLKEFGEYLSTVDLDIFKNFAMIYLYIEYTLGKDYINFYSLADEINSQDFCTKSFKNQEYSICQAFVQSMKNPLIFNHDFTRNIQLFVNNKTKISTEVVLLYYNYNLDEVILKII
jgi:hypothetical protein